MSTFVSSLNVTFSLCSGKKSVVDRTCLFLLSIIVRKQKKKTEKEFFTFVLVIVVRSDRHRKSVSFAGRFVCVFHVFQVTICTERMRMEEFKSHFLQEPQEISLDLRMKNRDVLQH